MSIQEVVTYFLLLITAWTLLHFLFVWMESKGRVYYRNKPNGSGVGNALHELNGILNSSTKSVLERPFERKKEDESEEDRDPIDQSLLD